MRAARLHAYHEPLRLEEIPVPDIGPTEVLIKVAAAGMCRSDFQQIEGYFSHGAPITSPITPGHEIAGRIAAVGTDVPAGLSEGDLVVVNPNRGDGTCRQCHEGNEQLCAALQMVGFCPPGGFAEYVPVPHRVVIPVADIPGQRPETLAPLTDAGLTPYRGMKKLRNAGKLGAGRSDEKLALATENGAHHTVNTRDKSAEAVQDELEQLTGRRGVDAVLDCAGSAESLGLAAAVLAIEGALTSVGLMGQQVELPLLPFVAGEKTYFGSFWGNHNDLTEVLALASAGLIKDSVTRVAFEDINDNLDALARGDIVGRAVITFD